MKNWDTKIKCCKNCVRSSEFEGINGNPPGFMCNRDDVTGVFRREDIYYTESNDCLFFKSKYDNNTNNIK